MSESATGESAAGGTAGSGIAAVSGASGFIGSAVVRRLLSAGRPVRALLEPGANTKNLEGLSVERVTVDVCDQDGMVRALEGASAFYHLAAIYKLWSPKPELLYRVNVEGTTASLLAAKRAGVGRVVYTSSIAAVGTGDRDRPMDETAEWNLYPIANEYITTKWISERIALQFATGADKGGLDLVVVNPAFPFGERDIGPTPTGRFIVSLLKGEVPGIGAGGFCAVDVNDVAAAHVAAETRGKVGERYILGNHNVTYREFFDMVGRIAGVKVPRLPIPSLPARAIGLGMELYADLVSHAEPLITYRSVKYTQNYAFFDVTKARRDLGLPQTPLETSIEKAVRFFRDNGMA